jgi:phage repressor protein C with HTH and peptisase S24 domain
MDKLTQLNELFAELRAQGRVHTQNDLADFAGVHKSTISAALKGNPKYLTESLLSRITKKMMSVPEDETTAFRVPLIPAEAHAGNLTDFADAVKDYDCEMVVSPVRGAAFAIQVTGDSMSPAYPSGARILCQRINEAAFVEWGRVYLLDTVNGAILKQVRKSDNVGCVTCCSLNPSPEYAPFELEVQYIRGWYRVLMIMSLV